MTFSASSIHRHYRRQATATLIQLAPVPNTYYPCLALTRDVEVYYVSGYYAAPPAAASLFWRATLDGVPYAVNVAAAAPATWYYEYEQTNGDGILAGGAGVIVPFLYDGWGHYQTCLVEMMTQTAGVAAIHCRVRYGTLD